jgi:hypothetical protein
MALMMAARGRATALVGGIVFLLLTFARLRADFLLKARPH